MQSQCRGDSVSQGNSCWLTGLAGVPLSSVWAFICLSSLAGGSSPLCFHLLLLLFLHQLGWGWQNLVLHHPPCLWRHWLLLLLSSLSRREEHPKLLGHLLLRSTLEDLPTQCEGAQGFPWTWTTPSNFPTSASSNIDGGEHIDWLSVGAKAIYSVLKLTLVC